VKDEPVDARPQSAGYRVYKFARKYRAALITAACFAVMIVGVSVFSI
jgi:hypothetical protein